MARLSCAAPELGGFARLLGEQLSITSEARGQLQRGRLALREKLDGASSSILLAWFARAVREQRVEVACAVRAHMAYLHRNLAPAELDQRAVATLLVSQVYLSTNFEGFGALEPVRDRRSRRSPSEAEAESEAVSRNSLLFDPLEVRRLIVAAAGACGACTDLAGRRGGGAGGFRTRVGRRRGLRVHVLLRLPLSPLATRHSPSLDSSRRSQPRAPDDDMNAPRGPVASLAHPLGPRCASPRGRCCSSSNVTVPACSSGSSERGAVRLEAARLEAARLEAARLEAATAC